MYKTYLQHQRLESSDHILRFLCQSEVDTFNMTNITRWITDYAVIYNLFNSNKNNNKIIKNSFQPRAIKSLNKNISH